MFLGIDACKGGWVVARVKDSGSFDNIRFEKSFDAILSLVQKLDITLGLIDIPIGLKSTGMEERKCDREARSFLGNIRGSSVFRVPIRSAIYSETREISSQINFQQTGKKISLQSWAIAPKIKEVDSLFRKSPDLQTYLRESHPEVCFCGLNSGQPMVFSKKDRRGLVERLKILKQCDYDSELVYTDASYHYPRTLIAKDDILDAMALAFSAYKVFNDRPYSFPGDNSVEIDEYGLRQEIIYWVSAEEISDKK